MKIIVSHDVDHFTAWEHRRDLILPKHIVRSFIELSLGYISLPEIVSRFNDLLKNKWHNLEELAEFDKRNEIHSTFFVAVRRGRKLNYSLKHADIGIKTIRELGLDIGVHGIGYDDLSGIMDEYNTFKSLLRADTFGIRLHDIGVRMRDIRLTNDNLQLFDQAGYLFSSNTFEWKNPFRMGKVWEFPVNIMDGYIFCRGAKWQNQTFPQMRRETETLLRKASDMDIKYFSILFHDCYFSESFKRQKKWYCWLVEYLKDAGWEFVNYKEAIQELEEKRGESNHLEI